MVANGILNPGPTWAAFQSTFSKTGNPDPFWVWGVVSQNESQFTERKQTQKGQVAFSRSPTRQVAGQDSRIACPSALCTGVARKRTIETRAHEDVGDTLADRTWGGPGRSGGGSLVPSGGRTLRRIRPIAVVTLYGHLDPQSHSS